MATLNTLTPGSPIGIPYGYAPSSTAEGCISGLNGTWVEHKTNESLSRFLLNKLAESPTARAACIKARNICHLRNPLEITKDIQTKEEAIQRVKRMKTILSTIEAVAGIFFFVGLLGFIVSFFVDLMANISVNAAMGISFSSASACCGGFLVWYSLGKSNYEKNFKEKQKALEEEQRPFQLELDRFNSQVSIRETFKNFVDFIEDLDQKGIYLSPFDRNEERIEEYDLLKKQLEPRGIQGEAKNKFYLIFKLMVKAFFNIKGYLEKNPGSLTLEENRKLIEAFNDAYKLLLQESTPALTNAH